VPGAAQASGACEDAVVLSAREMGRICHARGVERLVRKDM
jgi:hypothetical protein